MKKSFLRQISFAALGAVALLFTLSVDANAQNRNYNQRYDYNDRYNNNFYSPALENGYRLGFGAGSNDRSYRNSFDVDRSKTYRDADSGYRREFGDKDDYKRAFRDAFENGYRDGYSGRRSQFDQVNYRNNNRQRNRNNFPNSCPPVQNNRRGGWRY